MALLPKRSIILRSLLIVATHYIQLLNEGNHRTKKRGCGKNKSMENIEKSKWTRDNFVKKKLEIVHALNTEYRYVYTCTQTVHYAIQETSGKRPKNKWGLQVLKFNEDLPCSHAINCVYVCVYVCSVSECV